MEFTVSQIAELLNGTVEGDGTTKVSRLDKIQEGTTGGVSFLSNMKYEPHLYTTNSSAVIIAEDYVPDKALSTTLIKVRNPYTAFTQLLEAYSQLNKQHLSGVEEPSFIGENSSMGENGYRGAFSYIGKNCKIGQEVILHPNSYIGDNVQVGDRTIIHSGARICKDSVIGNDCEIHPNTVIGADGFGFAPQDDKTYKGVPQLGNVILEDHVSVGSNTTIDCATIGSTIIRRGVKIDNLVQIAHNVIIGENTVIAAQAGISGSTEIGKNCIIAGQAGLVGHLKIADNTIIGANTGISKSITKPGRTILGYMGFEMKDFLKSYSIFKNLPSLQEKIKELEKKQ
ncbi:UDP-3-O-acylglucosamine N-acyltransferase [Echinicola pacifica]|uniref:UDP-3-O-acylglucosamine N-acyltransferase n=1 Tax=Echinicola pacifica TaxID=346377 RepID=A0A918UQM4_9BACT|nr:UDP-3-O-(3-hydroxymyristoyl)glucosamine N-acyltransferase [Echinicola pacifica]GGZ27452.1 UDP-3-O-acylglucosamine N-acyltransferase [Echinicola pacifica]